jgi:tetratricopeptide (TPR) repeat protein
MKLAIWAAVAFTVSLSSLTAQGQSAYASQGQEPSATPAQQQSPGIATQQTPQQAEEMRAQILMAEKRFEEAIKAYQKLLVEQPKNARFANMLGVAYQQMGDRGRARSAYQRAAKLDATFADPYNNIGTTWYQDKNYRKAVRAYNKALRIDPSLATAYANLGYAYFSERKYPEAMDAFNKALTIDPGVLEVGGRNGSVLQDHSVSDHGMFYFVMAKTFAERGDAAQCAQNLLKAFDEGYQEIEKIKKDPSFAKVLASPDVQAVLLRATVGTNKPAAAPGT